MKDSNELDDLLEMYKNTGTAAPQSAGVITEHQVGPGDTFSHVS